ncbi:hypothetical protein CPZ87_21050 [Piscinibacter gummiphilus]|nr:hypothetical protein CPZ87_21050 [Piscinibacter gummiphilus]
MLEDAPHQLRPRRLAREGVVGVVDAQQLQVPAANALAGGAACARVQDVPAGLTAREEHRDVAALLEELVELAGQQRGRAHRDAFGERAAVGRGHVAHVAQAHAQQVAHADLAAQQLLPALHLAHRALARFGDAEALHVGQFAAVVREDQRVDQQHLGDGPAGLVQRGLEGGVGARAQAREHEFARAVAFAHVAQHRPRVAHGGGRVRMRFEAAGFAGHAVADALDVAAQRGIAVRGEVARERGVEPRRPDAVRGPRAEQHDGGALRGGTVGPRVDAEQRAVFAEARRGLDEADGVPALGREVEPQFFAGREGHGHRLAQG